MADDGLAAVAAQVDTEGWQRQEYDPMGRYVLFDDPYEAVVHLHEGLWHFLLLYKEDYLTTEVSVGSEIMFPVAQKRVKQGMEFHQWQRAWDVFARRFTWSVTHTGVFLWRRFQAEVRVDGEQEVLGKQHSLEELALHDMRRLRRRAMDVHPDRPESMKLWHPALGAPPGYIADYTVHDG